MASLESTVFTVSVAVATLGAVALVFVTCLWRHVARYYRELPAKIGVAVFRAVAASSALASKFATSPAPTPARDAPPPLPEVPLLEQPWVLTCLIAISGYFAWEVAGIVGDSKSKAAKERVAALHADEIELLTLDRDDARRQYRRLTRSASRLATLASEKFQRIRRAVMANPDAKPSLPAARNALDPDTQIVALLEALTATLADDAIEGVSASDQNFRVGLYAEQDGFLVPIDAFDMSNRRHDPFRSYEQHAWRFSLANFENPSHAVKCLRESRMLIVSDRVTDEQFEFFDEAQRAYLLSMVAYPLYNFCRDGVALSRAVLLIDTDVANYFREEDRRMLEFRLKQFACRIELEYGIKRLVG